MEIKNDLDMEDVQKLVDKSELWSMGTDTTHEQHAGSKRTLDEGMGETQVPLKKSNRS